MTSASRGSSEFALCPHVAGRCSDRTMKAFRRRDGVVTRVRKAVAIGLMTPMAAAALVGLGRPADADYACPPLASASIEAPSGTVTAGSSVHVGARISGLTLLQAHLQISGPGLDQQVGRTVTLSGTISGDVTVPKAGDYTLAVIGNTTQCIYKTAGFSVQEQAGEAKQAPSDAPGRSRRTGSSASGSRSNAGARPGHRGHKAAGAGAGDYAVNPQNGASPFNLPPVTPDGSTLNFEYPSPDPQIASPPPQPEARNVAQTTPIKWGPSLAIALVLLVISAHLGMWSRRQRLAAEGARAARRKRQEPAMMAAAYTGDVTRGDSGTYAEVNDGAGPEKARSRRRGRKYQGRRRRG